MQETQVRFLGLEDPLEKGMATHSRILHGEYHGQRAMVHGIARVGSGLFSEPVCSYCHSCQLCFA